MAGAKQIDCTSGTTATGGSLTSTNTTITENTNSAMRFICSILTLLLSAAILFPVVAQSDYVIIGTPQAADLYDQYEQRLSATAKAQLPPHIPFRIVKKKELMGDQITSGMQLSYLTTTYYLLLNDNGSPTGLPTAAAATFHRKCRPHNDTVLLTASCKLSSRFPSRGKQHRLSKGEKVQRIFTCRATTYLRSLSSPPLFGWTPSQRGLFKQIHSDNEQGQDHFSNLHRRIMKHLTKVNRSYDSLFTFFNATTGQQRAIPLWVAAPVASFRRYTLSGSPEAVRQLETSTQLIVDDVRQIVSGQPFVVNYEHGTITITPRTQP